MHAAVYSSIGKFVCYKLVFLCSDGVYLIASRCIIRNIIIIIYSCVVKLFDLCADINFALAIFIGVELYSYLIMVISM